MNAIDELRMRQAAPKLRDALERLITATDHTAYGAALSNARAALAATEGAAPAADDEWRTCEFCGCYTNARLRRCCDQGHDADAAPSPQPAQPDAALWNAYAEGRSDERAEAPLRPFGIEFDPEDQQS